MDFMMNVFYFLFITNAKAKEDTVLNYGKLLLIALIAYQFQQLLMIK